MGIQRFTASADTTITNAYTSNLRTRATASNMGLADSLEVFSIYAQADSGSSELSRMLLKFPVTDISSSRANKTIPTSGSVNFYLRLYNAEHPFTVPKDYTLVVVPVSRSWEEGYGLDMDEYSDLTYDGTGANWVRAASGSIAATLVDAIDCQGLAQNDAFTMTVPAAAGGDAVAHQFVFDNTTDINALSDATGFGISMTVASSYALMAAALIDAINGTANDAVQYGGANLGGDSTLTAGTIGLTAAEGSSDTQVTLTMDNTGADGNVANVLAANTGFEVANDLLKITTFTGGGNDWTSVGGDYHAHPHYTVVFSGSGVQDLSLDITPLMEEWIAETKSNYGLGIHLTSSQEAYFSSSTGDDTGSIPHNTSGRKGSFYTKKFFSRSSEFLLKRPIIEARWDSSEKDNRGNFYLSSSLAPLAENLNTIYMYNVVRGALREIPGVGSNNILVSVYSGSTDNTVPTGSKIGLPIGGGISANSQHNVTGGYVSTGIYSASFAYTSSAITKIFPVWRDPSSATEYHTGSVINVLTYDSNDYNPYPEYIIKINNLKDSYSPSEKNRRFRLFVREKDWSPNIYTKASKDIPVTIVENAYYKLYRTVDEFEVVAYGTGSTNHTRLSYDTSGSYFDFPMDILETGYMYAFKFLFKMPDGNYKEQSQIFKFRVD